MFGITCEKNLTGLACGSSQLLKESFENAFFYIKELIYNCFLEKDIDFKIDLNGQNIEIKDENTNGFVKSNIK